MASYLGIVNGLKKMIAAITTSAGAGDAGKIIATDTNGKIDNSFMPTGIGADTVSILTSEDIAAGKQVNIYDNTGTANARLADATTTGKHSHGFVLASTTSGQNATIYSEGNNDQVTGQTPGDVYLSTTQGEVISDPSTLVGGNILQKVGVATSATNINQESGDIIELV